jgi:hypothetical protein
VEPALPLEGAEFAAAFGVVAELSEPLEVAELAAEAGLAAELSEAFAGFEGFAGTEGEVVPPLLAAEPSLPGLAALFGAIALLELPVVELLVPESWANAIGAKAARVNAKPAPSK